MGRCEVGTGVGSEKKGEEEEEDGEEEMVKAASWTGRSINIILMQA